MKKKKLSRNYYCPVPKEQRPLNEYLKIKNSFLFNWSTFQLKQYIKTLLNINFYLLLYSVFFSTYFEYRTKFLLLIFFHGFFLEILILFRIYLGWIYIKNRLENLVVEYEETGYFDGKFWLKPIKILKQDKLFSYYKVSPIVKRLKKNILYFLFFLILLILLYIYIYL
jgi:hypothetical protein